MLEFAKAEGYWVAKQRADDVIGDDLIQLEGWRSSVLISRKLNFQDSDSAPATVAENGRVRLRDMTATYDEKTIEATFYGPTLTMASSLNDEELERLVARFTQAIVSANVADVTTTQ